MKKKQEFAPKDPASEEESQPLLNAIIDLNQRLIPHELQQTACRVYRLAKKFEVVNN